MDIYLVGGAVRDLLLGRPGGDRDYVIVGDPAAFLESRPGAFWAGKDFPVIIHKGREYAPLRGPDLESDLLERDLTVNAMALGPDGVLHAHPKALQDLQARVLRPAGERALAQDPARVFRAARLGAQLPDFAPHPDLFGAMRQTAAAGLLPSIAAERVAAELLKALACPRPGRFLGFLHHGHCLWPWFPELHEAHDIAAGPVQYHSGSVLSHTIEVMDALAARGADPMTVFMGLCHDLGKTATPRKLLPHHYGHENRGMELAGQLVSRLRLSNKHRKAGVAAAELHMQAGQYDTLRPGTRVDLLMKAHTAGVMPQLFELAVADGMPDFKRRAKADLRTILKVELPPKDKNKGPESGEKLRLLRCHVLSRP